MNTECMYVLKEKTVDAAKEFVLYLEDLAIKMEEEVSPTYISLITESFTVSNDYDGFRSWFKVKPGDIVVWAYGKDYCMYRIRPKGARRAFPYNVNPDDSWRGKVKDLWHICRDKNMKFAGFAECNNEASLV